MTARPTGSVTFLFTDIEGSTRLWDRDEALARDAVAKHDALLRGTIASHDGYVFKTVGDAFCAAFSTADTALRAAVAAQRSIAMEGAFPFRVRMALHTGTTHERDDDYFGPTVNRVARIQALASGGQVLLSAGTETLLRDALPAGVTLRDLGPHRLKDLQREERIFQVVGPALPDGFAPLVSLDALPNNLPLQLTSFLGREREVDDVRRSLSSNRLVTLTGAGGSGKSRLAIQVAAETLGDYPGGAWFVELAPVSDPADVVKAFASEMRVREEPGRDLLATMLDALRAKRTLVLLDNCEHLLEPCASLVERMLAACPNLRVLATSREALSASGEIAWRVPSLALPSAEADGQAAGASPAVALFLDRATAVNSTFRAGPDDLLHIAEICRRLDGIPLAIELAAARAVALSPRQIADRLNDRFRLLTGGRRTALPRQQTLKAAIDWGHDLLAAPERVTLRRLGVFVGGFDLEAAEDVCAGAAAEGAIERVDVLDRVAHLVAKSFVVVDDLPESGPRYRLLETVRQYALDRLLDAGEGPALRGRHRDWVTAFTTRLAPSLAGPDVRSALARLDAERDNVRAALEWCNAGAEGVTPGLGIATAITKYLAIRGRFADARAWLDGFLARADANVDPTLRAAATRAVAGAMFHAGDYAGAKARYEELRAIWTRLGSEAGVAEADAGLANVAFRLRDTDTAIRLGDEVVAVFRRLGDVAATADALVARGIVDAARGAFEDARARYDEAIPVLRRSGDVSVIAAATGNLAYLAYAERRFDRARELLEEQIAAFRTLGDRAGLANALNTKGAVLDALGDTAGTTAAFEESLALREALGLRALSALTLANLAVMSIAAGRFAEARSRFARSLEIAKESGDPWARARAVGRFALADEGEGRAERAVRILGAAEGATGGRAYCVSETERRDYGELRTNLRRALGDDAYEAARRAGAALTLDEAEALAREPRRHAIRRLISAAGGSRGRSRPRSRRRARRPPRRRPRCRRCRST